MSFIYYQTPEGSYLGQLNIVGWTVEQKKELYNWVISNTLDSIYYGNGLFEFQNINDITAFILTWT